MKKNTFRKFALMLMFLVSFTFILSGCNLFERNWFEYYNAVVVSIEYPDGDKIEINKRELLTAFNNYGQNLVSSYGYTYKEAVDDTLTQLVNQKVKLKIAENDVVISNAEKNKLYKDTLLDVESYLETYIDEVKKDWNITTPTIVDPEQEDEDIVLYTPYETKVRIEGDSSGNLKLVLIDYSQDEIEEDLEFAFMSDAFAKETISEKLYEYIINKTKFSSQNQTLTPYEEYEKQNARIYKEAVKRFTKTLKTSEEGMRLSTDDESVLQRAFQKFYENKLDNLLLTKMSEIITPTSEYASVNVAQVLSRYENMIKQSYEKYAYSASNLNSDMLNDFSNVNYYGNFYGNKHPQEYFFVSHFLLQLTDAQKQELEDLESKREFGGTGEVGEIEYAQMRKAILNRIPVIERDLETGKIIEVTNSSEQKYLSNIMAELEDAYLRAGNNLEKRVEAFKKIMYKYNQDPGILNSEYLYVIGTEDSNMDAEFTRVARELHENGVAGAYSASPAVSTYGVHILFYAGEVSSHMPYEFSNLNSVILGEEEIFKLEATLLNPFNNKTLLDKVFESIQTSIANNNEGNYLNVIKEDLKITKYTSNYKDLILD